MFKSYIELFGRVVNIWWASSGIQVLGLQVGQTYRFRVSAVNDAGVGPASLPSEPIAAHTKPGQAKELILHLYIKLCEMKKLQDSRCFAFLLGFFFFFCQEVLGFIFGFGFYTFVS